MCPQMSLLCQPVCQVGVSRVLAEEGTFGKLVLTDTQVRKPHLQDQRVWNIKLWAGQDSI